MTATVARVPTGILDTFGLADWKRSSWRTSWATTCMRSSISAITTLAIGDGTGPMRCMVLDAITDGGWHPVYCAEGIWVLGIVQQQYPAARLLRQLLTERGLPQPRKRTEEEIQTDGVNRRVAARR